MDHHSGKSGKIIIINDGIKHKLALWYKQLVARLPLLGSWVCISVIPCVFHGGQIGICIGFSQCFSFSPVTNLIPPLLYPHLTHFLSFHFIFLCDGVLGLVSRHNCYSQTLRYRGFTAPHPLNWPCIGHELRNKKIKNRSEWLNMHNIARAKTSTTFIIIISVFCPRAGPSLHAHEPGLQFCQRQVFQCKLRNQGCNFTRDWIGVVASRCFLHPPLSLTSEQTFSEKNPGAPMWRWGEWIWLAVPSGLHRNSPQGLNVSSIRIFDQIRDPEIPITLHPLCHINSEIKTWCFPVINVVKWDYAMACKT